MDLRMRERSSAVTMVTTLGLAAILAACGDRAASPTGSETSGSGSTAASMPETVDVNNPAQVASVINALGVETPASEPIGTDRAAGAVGDVFPTWPAGAVRLKGLATYRLDTRASYEDDGTLRFLKGSKPLFEAAFRPEKDKTVGRIPPAVLAELKGGDTVTWGIYFANKAKKPVTLSFTLIDKPQVTKALTKLDAENTTNKVFRDLAAAQVLENYGLHAEALELYVRIHDADDGIDYVWNPILRCLRALKLKGTPLYDDAQIHAKSEVPPRSVPTRGEPVSRTMPSPRAGTPPDVAPMPSPSTTNPLKSTGPSGGPDVQPSTEPIAPVEPMPPAFPPTPIDPTKPPPVNPPPPTVPPTPPYVPGPPAGMPVPPGTPTLPQIPTTPVLPTPPTPPPFPPPIPESPTDPIVPPTPPPPSDAGPTPPPPADPEPPLPEGPVVPPTPPPPTNPVK